MSLLERTVKMNTKNFFENKIKPALVYIGSIGAGLTSFAYVCLVSILIWGFQAHNVVQTLIFAVINGIIGFMILQFLKIQGSDFAKTLPANKELLEEYYRTKTKDKKLHSMKWYWLTSIAKDIAFKAVSIMISTAGLIYIVVEGSEDYLLLLLALVNILMFLCFGLLGLSNTYDFFNNEYMNYVKEQIKMAKEAENESKLLNELFEEDTKERVLPEAVLEVYETEVLEQAYDTSVHLG